MQESLHAGQGFTDNEVTLVIDGRSHILSLTAQRLPEGYILLEMAPMDNQRRLSQEQLQHAQQVAARDLVRGLAHEIKNPLGGLRGAAQLLERQLDGPADRPRLVDRLLVLVVGASVGDGPADDLGGQSAHRPAATATAEPDDEPPEIRSGRCASRTAP